MSVDRNVGQVTVLRSTESILYTWDDPNGSRKVEWKSYKGEEDPMEVVVDKVTWRRVYDLLACYSEKRLSYVFEKPNRKYVSTDKNGFCYKHIQVKISHLILFLSILEVVILYMMLKCQGWESNKFNVAR